MSAGVWTQATLAPEPAFLVTAFLFFFFSTFIYFWDRERQSMNGGGAEREREGDTESETGSRLWAVSTEANAGLKLTDREIVTWAGQTLNQLSHPGAPNHPKFLKPHISHWKIFTSSIQKLFNCNSWYYLPHIEESRDYSSRCRKYSYSWNVTNHSLFSN